MTSLRPLVMQCHVQKMTLDTAVDGDFTFNRYTLFSIICQNSFLGTPCQNTILGTLLALVS